ncbi:MAG: glutamate--tRNA ligase [Nitrospinae bacterium]|nr:glutamate--tRNA ligase [Nitrospinota bacterium]
MSVRVRFAPSPTGAMHVGNLRTALFNRLFALRHGGTLILRIEDTDRARHDPLAERTILDALTRLGIGWDEGPYRQSERLDLYRDAVERLAADGKVYRCFCTEGELESDRAAAVAAGKPPRYSGRCRTTPPSNVGDAPFVWRFMTGDRPVSFDDGVRGNVTFSSADFGDFPVARSDGSPLFLFASAVDDAEMRITDVIRGEDHLSNTPRQLMLFEALGVPAPRYHHLPIIVDDEGKKLSKRKGAIDPAALLDEGFLPESIVTGVALLGWAGIDGKEALNIEEMATRFDIGAVSRSPSRYDFPRIDHLNVTLLKETGGASLVPLFAAHGLTFGGIDPVTVARLVAGTVKRTDEAIPFALQFARPLPPDDEAAALLADPAARGVVEAALDAVGGGYDAVIESSRSKTGAKGKALFAPLRAALTGRLTGPNLKDLFDTLGSAALAERLSLTVNRWRS